MKAWMPNFMARFRLLLAVAAGLHISAAHVAAVETAARASDTASRTSDATAPDRPESPAVPRPSESNTPTRPTYQNPFGAEAKAPPMDSALQTHSAGQWRRPTIPRWVAPPSEPVAIKQPPGPAESVPPPPEKSLVSPVGQQAQDTTPAANTPLAKSALPPQPQTPAASAALVQPDSVGNGPPFPAATSAGSSRPSASGATAKPNLSVPTIGADRTNTAESCLARAQAAAAHANSVNDLTNVIELCDRGLGQKPSATQQLPLQRLAAWAHNRRGEMLADSQRLDEALRDFQAAIELDPQCSLAFHNRGVTFAQRNQYAAALRDFNRVIELNPGLGIAYRNRAELLSALDRTQDALADYDRALASLPNDAALYLARAHAKQRLGNFAGAAADIEQALKRTPNDAAALVQRGNLAADRGRFADAEKDFRQALKVNPKLAEAHRSLGWLQATCPDAKYRKPDQALASAQRAAELSPDDYQVIDTLAAAEASNGNFAKAAELQQKALASAPRNLNNPLQERLAQYQRQQAYRTPAPPRNVRTAAMEAPATSPIAPAMPPAPRSGIAR